MRDSMLATHSFRGSLRAHEAHSVHHRTRLGLGSCRGVIPHRRAGESSSVFDVWRWQQRPGLPPGGEHDRARFPHTGRDKYVYRHSGKHRHHQWSGTHPDHSGSDDGHLGVSVGMDCKLCYCGIRLDLQRHSDKCRSRAGVSVDGHEPSECTGVPH